MLGSVSFIVLVLAVPAYVAAERMLNWRLLGFLEREHPQLLAELGETSTRLWSHLPDAKAVHQRLNLKTVNPALYRTYQVTRALGLLALAALVVWLVSPLL